MVLGVIRYLAGAALAVAGAAYVAFALAVPLASVEPEGDAAERGRFELLAHAFKSADPIHLAAGGVVTLAGLLLARAPFSIGVARKRKRRPGRTPAEQAVEDLASADPEVRLDAVSELLSAADPSTIPTLIRALGDPTTKVRGQACEALANMTGETFDFVDIAPEPVRAESIAQWEAWWNENRGAILSGADPRELAEEPVREAPAAEAAPLERVPSRPGRNVSLGDVIRKKRMRESSRRMAEPAPAVPQRPGPPPAAPARKAPEKPLENLLPDVRTDAEDLPPPDDDELPPID